MSSKQWINKYFSEDELKEIQLSLDEVEKSTSGEIILSLRNKKKFLEKLYSNHELALKDFDVLGAANTKERTGLLIFIIFEDRYYNILADEGINSKISDDVWNTLEKNLKEEFRNKKYAAGLLTLIESISGILRENFPVRAGAVNDDEIENELIIN